MTGTEYNRSYMDGCIDELTGVRDRLTERRAQSTGSWVLWADVFAELDALMDALLAMGD